MFGNVGSERWSLEMLGNLMSERWSLEMFGNVMSERWGNPSSTKYYLQMARIESSHLPMLKNSNK